MIGATPFKRVSTADTNAASISAVPTQLTCLVVGNINAAMAYLKLFDKASAPTLGTDVPKMIIPIPGNASGAGGAVPLGEKGVQFNNGLAIAIVTGMADANTTGVAAAEVCVSGAYDTSKSGVF